MIPGPKILVVEDDTSIRETLQDLLVSEGYDVSAADHAEAGLKLLAEGPVHLVLTDYALPGGTGTWMIAEARKRAILGKALVLVITAHPTIDNAEGLEVIRKPLDVDEFLSRVHTLLAHVRGQVVSTSQDLFARYLKPEQSTKVELVLYISAHSPSSLKAMRNVQRMLNRYETKDIQFRICDLSKEPPQAAEEDKIAFTPTLVKRKPDPRTWILGDLDNAQVLEDLLILSGAELKK